MPQSFINLWIHTVFSTKDRMPLIHPSFEQRLFDHIRAHLEHDLHCPVAAINGMNDHLHILFNLNPELTIRQVMKNVKGESSHWVNQQEVTKMKFAWQSGYGAFSVDWDGIEPVIHYIDRQKEHHRIRSFAEEYHALFGHLKPETDESIPGADGS